MAKRRMIKRTEQPGAAGVRLLNTFFHALSNADRGKLASLNCDGIVTGADLSEVLGWTRDKTSRQIRVLCAGGIVETRRQGRWVRVTPQLAAAGAAKAWAEQLRADEPPDKFPIATLEERGRRAQLLADPGRRSLLTAVKAKPASTQAELARACGLSQPVASRSLTRLVDFGFITADRDGGRPRHTLRAEPVEALWAWLQVTQTRLIKGRETALGVVLRDPGMKRDRRVDVPTTANLHASQTEEASC